MEQIKTIEQLKVEAYDCLAQIEAWQKKLRVINTQIANFKPAEVKEEIK